MNNKQLFFELMANYKAARTRYYKAVDALNEVNSELLGLLVEEAQEEVLQFELQLLALKHEVERSEMVAWVKELKVGKMAVAV